MRLLVTGSDGRAHALVWKLFNSPLVHEVICAPGNGGSSQLAPSIDFEPYSAAEIGRWAFEEQIDLIVPAEATILADGLVDEVLSFQIGVCGAPQRSAQLEQSRCFARELAQRHDLPSARGRVCPTRENAERYLPTLGLPVVIKADDLRVPARVYYDRYSALNDIDELISLGSAGVVIEEHLSGPRIAFSALVDGSHALPFSPVQIIDRLSADDRAEYAPAIAAYSTASVFSRRLGEYLQSRFIEPLLRGLAADGLPYWGILGVDCIVTAQGPRLTSLRCSFKDLEAQALLPRLDEDLLPVLQDTIARTLAGRPALQLSAQSSAVIALVAQGYPHPTPSIGAIDGLAELDPGVLAFHSQTRSPLGMRYQSRRSGQTIVPISTMISGIFGGERSAAPSYFASGNHVLSVVALGPSRAEAHARALANAARIRFSGAWHRQDLDPREFGA